MEALDPDNPRWLPVDRDGKYQLFMSRIHRQIEAMKTLWKLKKAV